MITITVTTEQLKTINRALEAYTYDLQENYEPNETQEDELERVVDALLAIRHEGTWAVVDGLNQRID